MPMLAYGGRPRLGARRSAVLFGPFIEVQLTRAVRLAPRHASVLECHLSHGVTIESRGPVG
jgi:hypothetical protein